MAIKLCVLSLYKRHKSLNLVMFEVAKKTIMPYKTVNNLISFTAMWYKINELSRKNLTQVQIAALLDVNRSTVRRYQMMSEAEFKSRVLYAQPHRKHKLDGYRGFITKDLQDAPYLSCAQVKDHLLENFPDMPYVSDRTVYNYVMRVREEEDIPVMSEPVRQMHKLPECEYGEQAQVDYGEKWLRTSSGHRVKVHVFVMVLSRSRYKFVHLQNVPFTAGTTVYAHHLAFKFFGGMPRKILYDQDCKLLCDENYGDYKMTDEMAKFIAGAGFEPVFAMPRDPQTKGKVENAVGYVKNNFLRGRVYQNIELLNEQAIGWLGRTANAKPHAMTRLVPADVFEEERKHLLPYTLSVEEPKADLRAYTVRSDNTILYHSNTYDLPSGTYKGKGTKVLVSKDLDANQLAIYDEDSNTLITRHEISPLKGMHITMEGHATVKQRDMLESEKILHEYLVQWGEDCMLSKFLAELKYDRPRYYAKSVKAMASFLTNYNKDSALALVELYSEQKVYNAAKMEEIATGLCNRETDSAEPTIKVVPHGLNKQDITPEKRSVKDYEQIIGEGGAE